MPDFTVQTDAVPRNEFAEAVADAPTPVGLPAGAAPLIEYGKQVLVDALALHPDEVVYGRISGYVQAPDEHRPEDAPEPWPYSSLVIELTGQAPEAPAEG